MRQRDRIDAYGLWKKDSDEIYQMYDEAINASEPNPRYLQNLMAAYRFHRNLDDDGMYF